MPSFNDLFSATQGKYQGVAVAGLQSRYFTDTANLVGYGFQNAFRDLLGWAGSFSFCIEGGTDPNLTTGCGFSAVVLSAASAFHHSGKCVLSFVLVWLVKFC